MNFGCGSSREHAAWALQEYGFDVVVAPSFGDIFRSNCLKVGLVPVELPAADVAALIDAARDRGELTVDLERQEITGPGIELAFEFDPFQRESIINGLDDIARSLANEDAIAAYEASRTPRFDTLVL